MAARTLLRRLPSPVGFLLVVVCFLLPFVTVSCSAVQLPETTSVTYTGIDLATGHVGTIGVDGPPEDFTVGFARPAAAQPFLIIALVLVALGILASLVPAAWWRALSSGAAAVLALIFLAGGQVNGTTAATKQARMDAELLYGSPDHPPLVASAHTEYGFWLAVGLLVALAVAAAVEIVVHSRRKPADPAPQIPATVDQSS